MSSLFQKYFFDNPDLVYSQFLLRFIANSGLIRSVFGSLGVCRCGVNYRFPTGGLATAGVGSRRSWHTWASAQAGNRACCVRGGIRHGGRAAAHKQAMDEMMQLSQADQEKWYGEFVAGFAALPDA